MAFSVDPPALQQYTSGEAVQLSFSLTDLWGQHIAVSADVPGAAWITNKAVTVAVDDPHALGETSVQVSCYRLEEQSTMILLLWMIRILENSSMPCVMTGGWKMQGERES